MVPEVRRIAILLDAIPPAERAEVVLIVRAFTGSASSKHTLRFVGVDVQGSCVVFADGGAGMETRGSIPLDAVELVWKNFNRWWVLARGSFSKVTTESWEYSPI